MGTLNSKIDIIYARRENNIKHIEEKKLQLKDENEIIQSQMMTAFCELETVIRQGRDLLNTEFQRQKNVFIILLNRLLKIVKIH